MMKIYIIISKQNQLKWLATKKNSQGIKHSNYAGEDYETRKMMTYEANIKALGTYGDIRVLLKIMTASTGEMLYESRAVAYGVH